MRHMLLQLVQEMLTFIGGLVLVYFVYIFFTRKYGNINNNNNNKNAIFLVLPE